MYVTYAEVFQGTFLPPAAILFRRFSALISQIFKVFSRESRNILKVAMFFLDFKGISEIRLKKFPTIRTLF